MLRKNGDDLSEKDKRKILDGIKGVTEGAKKTGNKSLRKAAFVSQWVAFGMVMGRKAIKGLNERFKNLRLSPLAIGAVVMYLESRRVDTCDPSFGSFCKPLANQIQKELPKLYKQAIFGLLRNGESVNTEYPLPKHSGYLFHLATLAVHHLNYEISNGKRPIAIELTTYPELILKRKHGANKVIFNYIRYVDLVLAGDNEDIPSKKSIFVETKSYSKPKKIGSYWQPWDLTKGKQLSGYKKNHKQFYLDRVAITKNRKADGKNIEPLASEFQWWFQSFKRSFKGSKLESYDSGDLKIVAKHAKKLPSKSRNINAVSVGYSDERDHNANYQASDVEKHLHLFNVKTWLIEENGRNLLEGIDEELIDELINLNQQF